VVKDIMYQVCGDYFDKKLRILPRLLVDITEISLEITIFG
jgi:hypothetical protein